MIGSSGARHRRSYRRRGYGDNTWTDITTGVGTLVGDILHPGAAQAAVSAEQAQAALAAQAQAAGLQQQRILLLAGIGAAGLALFMLLNRR